MAPSNERWPPVYDAEDLKREIGRLTSKPGLYTHFYEWRRDRSIERVRDICQGDVLRFSDGVPCFDEDGAPAVVDHATRSWLVIGNSCDFDRAHTDAPYTQLVPITRVAGEGEVSPSQRQSLTSYTQSRTFFIPPWCAETEGFLHVAEFLRPVALDKRAARDEVLAVEARMSFAAWALLNACLVRFLARDDGRYDTAVG